MPDFEQKIDANTIEKLMNEFSLDEGIVNNLLDSLNESINLLLGTDFNSRFGVLLQQPSIQGLSYKLFCDEFLKCTAGIINMKLFTQEEIVLALSKLGKYLKQKESKK